MGEFLHATPRPDGAVIDQLEVRPGTGVYLNIGPETALLHQSVANHISDIMADWATKFPQEDTLAQREYGVPSLIVRLDGGVDPATGALTVYEIDDHPSGAAIVQKFVPKSRETFSALAGHLASRGVPLTRAFLDVGAPYIHDDERWIPHERRDDGSSVVDGTLLGPDETSVVARARRGEPEFPAFIDLHGPQSIMPAWERDNKIVLAGMGLAKLVEGGIEEYLENRDYYHQSMPSDSEVIVVKAAYASRGEAIVFDPKVKIRKGVGSDGVYTPNQMRRRVGGGPVVLQPYVQPPSMAEIGLRFSDDDHAKFQKIPERHGAPRPDKFQPGTEDINRAIVRVFGVYNPATKRYDIPGGMLMARAGRSVHGASDSIMWPLAIADKE